MANETVQLDPNGYPVMLAVTDDAAQEVRKVRVDPSTGYPLVILIA
ncbi:MAG: hypothetical protein WC052_05300 [Patescibacteria group bacterium]